MAIFRACWGLCPFALDIHLGYLSLQVGSWDIYWNHLHREFVVCRGMETMVHWPGSKRPTAAA
jgi:hypothetical protein